MPYYNRSNEECRIFLEKKLPHYHMLWLNDKIMTNGRVDRNHEFDYIGLRKDHFTGKSVLDVGALDGVIAFNAEKNGANRVVAIDVEDVEDYDWGYAGPDPKNRGLGEIKNKVFQELREFFDSDVERYRLAVYDLDPEQHGQFDIVFFYGVLYHLRHPLLAFDRIRGVCRDMLCMETHVSNIDPLLPSALFYIDDVLDGTWTNWTGPSESCVVHWMKDAGFEKVYVEKSPRMKGRQRFIGFVDKSRKIDRNITKNFRVCDEEYFRQCRHKVANQIGDCSADANKTIKPVRQTCAVLRFAARLWERCKV